MRLSGRRTAYVAAMTLGLGTTFGAIPVAATQSSGRFRTTYDRATTAQGVPVPGAPVVTRRIAEDTTPEWVLPTGLTMVGGGAAVAIVGLLGWGADARRRQLDEPTLGY